MTEIRNLTPHDLTIVKDGEVILNVPSEGPEHIARVSQTTTLHESIVVNGTEVSIGSSVFGEVQNLPEKEEGTLLFVSAMVATAAWQTGRDDVVCPLSAVRNENGQIIGTSGLAVKPR